MKPIFKDRRDAGRVLAGKLDCYKHRQQVTVLALPRGGVPVAVEVARALDARLDVFPVRKLGVPGFGELAMGAIAPGNVRVLNQDVVRQLNIPEQAIEQVAALEERELERRERLYRGGRPLVDLSGQTAILVDDGLATGATMRAAVTAVRTLGATRVVVAVPVAPAETCEALAQVADEVVCAYTPERFRAIGPWYRSFEQLQDAEVRQLLEEAQTASSRSPAGVRAVASNNGPALA